MIETNPPVINPLPAGTRHLLLDFLAAVYSAGCAQTRLNDAPDAAVAWQVQSALDDFADYAVLKRFRVANDDLTTANDNVTMKDAA